MKYRGNRGSEWRKWDLHVHTPESGMSNKFGNNWDEYVKALFQTAILNEVAVIGITDYFTIDGYKKLKREYCENVPKLLELFDNDAELVDKIRQIKLFPNIEFRLNTFVGSSRINYHVIFSDQLSIEDIEDSFLHELKFSYEQYPDATDCRHSLKRSNIENLGKKLKSEQPSFRDSDFVVGCTNAVVNDNQIRETLKNYSDKFEGKYIIVVPVDEDLSSLSWNGQDHHVRKGFYQHANAFFTSNIKTIEFALGKYDKDNYLNEFKSFKPCFTGCDAHSCEEIKQKLGQHYTKYNDSNPKKVDYEVKTTWIKADTTFEGLLQTLFEPESRVRIQSSRPETKPERSVISSVMFQSSEELFGNQVIHLNECLNSIIGGKSSGKSLLLHSMACAIDKDQVERISKTLNIGEYNSVFDYDLIVTWQDGITNSLSNNYTEEVKREITYIPQLYINYLAEKENREELNKLLLNILLQNSSFNIFYWSKRKEIEQVTSAIEVAYSKMISSRDKALLHQNELKRVGKSQEIMKSIEKLNAQIDAITRMSTLSFKEQDEYKRLIDQEKALYAEKQIIQNNIETKRDIAVEINDTITNFETISLEKERLKLFLETRNVGVIIDESTKIKNPNSKLTQDFFEIRTLFQKRIIMTGTPIANRPYDIWAQIFFLDSGCSLGVNFEEFKSTTDLSNDLSDNKSKQLVFEESVAEIFSRIKDFTVRETKDSGIITLPNKVYHDIYIDFERTQKEMYEHVRDDMQIMVQKGDSVILDESPESIKRLLRLVQITSNPLLLDGLYGQISGKEAELEKLISDIINRNEKVIVWSIFTDNIDYFTKKYSLHKAVKITGKMNIEDRKISVKKFKEGDSKILFATPQAAKEGLTLTVANNVIFYDRGFSLDDYLQAQDRIHRISQTKECNIYNIMVNDSIDIWVNKLLQSKQNAAFLAQGDKSLSQYQQDSDYSYGEMIKDILKIQ